MLRLVVFLLFFSNNCFNSDNDLNSKQERRRLVAGIYNQIYHDHKEHIMKGEYNSDLHCLYKTTDRTFVFTGGCCTFASQCMKDSKHLIIDENGRFNCTVQKKSYNKDYSKCEEYNGFIEFMKAIYHDNSKFDFYYHFHKPIDSFSISIENAEKKKESRNYIRKFIFGEPTMKFDDIRETINSYMQSCKGFFISSNVSMNNIGYSNNNNSLILADPLSIFFKENRYRNILHNFLRSNNLNLNNPSSIKKNITYCIPLAISKNNNGGSSYICGPISNFPADEKFKIVFKNNYNFESRLISKKVSSNTIGKSINNDLFNIFEELFEINKPHTDESDYSNGLNIYALIRQFDSHHILIFCLSNELINQYTIKNSIKSSKIKNYPDDYFNHSKKDKNIHYFPSINLSYPFSLGSNSITSLILENNLVMCFGKKDGLLTIYKYRENMLEKHSAINDKIAKIDVRHGNHLVFQKYSPSYMWIKLVIYASIIYLLTYGTMKGVDYVRNTLWPTVRDTVNNIIENDVKPILELLKEVQASVDKINSLPFFNHRMLDYDGEDIFQSSSHDIALKNYDMVSENNYAQFTNYNISFILIGVASIYFLLNFKKVSKYINNLINSKQVFCKGECDLPCDMLN